MNVLLTSIAFPPKRDPESLQVAKYCKYLSQIRNVRIEVITSANPTLHMDPDFSLLSYVRQEYDVHELKIIENRFVNYLLRKISPLLTQLPDTKFTFALNSSGIIKRLKRHPDLLYSRSYPLSSTLLAYRIKRRLNIPWVLHLSDPWALSSLESATPATSFKGYARAWNKRMEEKCFALADYICLTSLKTITLYVAAYPNFADKFYYMPNVYDDELFTLNPYVAKNRLRFVYTGGFGEARSPLSLLKAIEYYLTRYGEHKPAVEFLFTGEMTRNNAAIFHSFQHLSSIRVLGVLPYNEMLQLQRDSDVLINIDSDISDSRHSVFFPSKLLEYMAAQRRILAITNEHSTTYEVVQNKLGNCFSFHDIEGVAEFFNVAYSAYEKNNVTFFKPAVESIQQFSARQNAKRLFILFQKCLNVIE